MLKYVLAAFILITTVMACKTTTAIFGKRTPHEQYADKLNNAGLQQSAAGSKWFTVANKALVQPLAISVPYEETGYFDAASPAAAGYRFSARRGDKIAIAVVRKPVNGFSLFMDLWQPAGSQFPKQIVAADSSLQLEQEVKEAGTYILRLQPELLAGGEYTVTIKTQPSLAFPVPAVAKPRIISLWGVDRDGGARSHEGIDIAAAKRTPLVACANGYVTSTRENNLGGKVVFLRPDGKDYTLYYAHLDEQLVQEGQRVNKGDTIGLMGNTGNARYTVPHLHFGIYAAGGAIDPLPFVEISRPQVSPVTASLQLLNGLVRVNKGTALLDGTDKKLNKTETLPANTLLKVTGASTAYYKITTANDSLEGYVAAASVVPATKGFTTYQTTAATHLLDKPNANAASKILVSKGSKLEVLGVYGRYYFVNNSGSMGWVTGP